MALVAHFCTSLLTPDLSNHLDSFPGGRSRYDEGKSWPFSKVIHEGPAAYSCLTRIPDGAIGILYETGEKNPCETIRFARFGIRWLTDGKDSLWKP